MNQLFSFQRAIEGSGPDLPFQDESDDAAPWRYGGFAAFADQTGRLHLPAGGNHPDLLLRSGGIARGVRIFAGAIRALAAHVKDLGAVRSPAQLRYFLPIVVAVGGDG